MKMKNIRELIRSVLIFIRYFIQTKLYGMDISPKAKISFGAKLDKTFSEGVHIDEDSYIASGAIILSHDFSRDIKSHTYIGKKCFIGANAIVLAGIKIGDEVIVGAGAIVTKDIPSRSIVAGNPAKILQTGIRTKRFGQLIPK
jgi:acetyltransferase-like isoleucine patch superfamily enzyme